jgi:uncharacterized DUF497 family protein
MAEGASPMEFSWNESKAARNLARHGVAFSEAATVFNDLLYIDFFDPDHSETEHRYIRVGCSEQGRLLVVSYTEDAEIARLISARPATRSERETYEEQ